MANMYGVIEDLCAQRGIKVGKLCAELGMRRSVLSDLKAGRTKTLSVATTARIADYFGVSTDYLLGTETEKAPTLVYESGRNVNIVTIAGRDGSYMEKRLTDEQVKALQTIIDQMPEAPDDL